MAVDKSVVAVFFIGFALILSLIFFYYSKDQMFSYIVLGAFTSLLALIDPKAVLSSGGKNA